MLQHSGGVGVSKVSPLKKKGGGGPKRVWSVEEAHTKINWGRGRGLQKV